MTFSIVALDAESGDLGIAVASKFPAAGAAVPFARAGVGAIATQASANTTYGPEGLTLMAGGMDAASALDALVAADDGRTSAKRGSSMLTAGWPPIRVRRASSGPAVSRVMVTPHRATSWWAPGSWRRWPRHTSQPRGTWSTSLLAALLAGDSAGGDARGRQSAALLVVREAGGYMGFNDRYVDLRVDDHPEAPTELARVFQVWEDTMLVRSDTTIEASAEVVADLQRALKDLGYFTGEPSGTLDDATRKALEDWAGWENLELRLRTDDLLSVRLVGALRAQAEARG